MNYIAFDLDRVIFNTDKFSKDVTEISAELCRVSAEQFKKDSQSFRIKGDIGLHHYDYAAQLASYGANIADVYPVLLKSLTTHAKTYIYNDVVRVIEQCQMDNEDIFILTYGEDMYQKLKLKVCPQLDAITSYVILQTKGEFIDKKFPESSGVLFDDTYQEWLPSGWQHVTVDRVAVNKDGLLQAFMQWRQNRVV